MNWLILSWALTLGFVPSVDNSIINGLQVTGIGYSNVLEAQLDVSAVILGHLRLEGSAETYMLPPSDGWTFLPFRADYTFGAALFSGNFEVGLRHECDHGIEYTNDILPWYGSSETLVYVKITGGSK